MFRLLAVAVVCLISVPALADVITRLPTSGKVVALTFDGCEAPGRPAYLDLRIVDVLTKEHLPYAIFSSGLFALRNKDDLARLAASPLVEIENHSMTHPQHMERLDKAAVEKQVADADAVIEAVTGRRPKFFRFPAGNYNAETLAQVEAMGHRVVHWRVPSGDPAKGVSPGHLAQWVVLNAKPGDILIFHINGRAPETADALPIIVKTLKAKGFDFVRLDQLL